MNIDDANNEFLTVDATAANAEQLGEVHSADFFQGTGHVVTGVAESVPVSDSPTKVLSLADGTISVYVANQVGNGLQLELQNATAVTLSTVDDKGVEHDLNPNTSSSMPLVTPLSQTTIQIFPSGTAFPEVVTIILSVESSSGLPTVVAQALSGPA